MNLSTKRGGYQLLVCILAIWGFSASYGVAQINSYPYSYDFETEGSGSTGCNPSHTMLQLGWLNATTGDDMDWTSDQNGTGSGNTGPSDDHTPGAGNTYMYLETSCTALRTANLETPIFDFTSAPSPQLSFWYHMYGSGMGDLFFEVTTNGGTTWTTLQTISGQQQNSSAAAWLQATVNISAYGGMSNVRFRFRGTTQASSFQGDMAIDDFLVENILPNNTGVSAMISPVLGSTAGNYSVDVTVRNFGSNPVTPVTIEWEMNGVAQTSFTYTGAAIPAFTSAPVNLSASTAFAAGLTSLKFWTSMPNSVVDTDNGNDTLNAIFCTGLGGVYTVGTATSDFVTIADALAALNGCGMGAPVTMNVQAGTYTTPIALSNTIPGLSATNTLTWDGMAQTANIQVASGAAITLDGADNITIRNFSINHTGTSTAFGVLLTNQADNNNITGNRITLATTSFASGCIVSSNSTTSATASGNNANNTLIENNTLVGGYRGVSVYGQSSTYNARNIIRNNDISNSSTYGIYAYYQDSLLIHGNNIHDFSTTFHYGIYAYYSMNSAFTANTIIVDDYGFYFGRTNSNTTPTRDALIANNMVISQSDRAFYAYFTRNTNFYHNTFKSSMSAFVLSNIDNTINIKNNIFYSENSYAFESFSSSAIADMDYNGFYTPATNTNFINYNGIYLDLNDWKTNGTFGYGQNSQEGLPIFTGANDLHLEGVFLNDMGTNVGILTDIDGDVRPATGATSVDIGADEFTPPNNDAGVTSLINPILPISTGFSTVEVEVRNFGVRPLTSFMIEWEINGVAQVAVPYIGATVPVLGATTVNLANINFPTTTTQLKFWTSMPNGVVDDRLTNDTLELMICPGLQGVYTVGHATSDFPTVAEAMNALMSCGVSAAVELQFQVGTYNGQLAIAEIPGASAVNTITFNGISPADATLTHDGTGMNGFATIALDGADYITIKNFNIVSTSVAAAYGVLLTNQANHNHILNNTITVPYMTGINNVVGVLASNSFTASIGSGAEGDNTNWTTIEGNDISGGTVGIILEGGAFDQENTGNSIISNNIHGADDYGIYIDEQDTLKINKNTIYNIQQSFSDAIFTTDIHNFQMIGNTITTNDYGIYVSGGFSFADKARNGLLVNNMVTGLGSNSEAVYLRDVDMIQIYHNTLSGSPALYLDNQTNIDLRNNILATANDYCYETFDPVSMSAMDYNLFYVSGSGNAVRFGSAIYATLAIWQTTGPAGYDQNSVSGNPNFVNGLHVASNAPEDLATTTGLLYNVTEDIDGDSRPMGTAPDIGADEHVSIANDAMAVGLVSPAGCGMAASDVIVSIANVGSTALIATGVTVNVTGAATQTYTTSIPVMIAGTTFNVNMGTLNTLGGGTYNFEIIVASTADTNPTNDTINITQVLSADNQTALTNVGDTLVCAGNMANLALSSSIAGTQILWYDSLTGGSLITSGNNYTTGAINTTTTYYAQLQTCNSARKAITVQADLVGINVDMGADTTSFCNGSTLEIIPTVTLGTAQNMIWSNGASSSLIQVTTTGLYAITVTTASGCTATDSTVVISPAQPTISNTASQPTCGGLADGAIDMTVAGTTPTYAWSNGAITEDITGLNAGIYLVTVTDNGCSYTNVITLTEPTVLTSNIDATTIDCNTNGTIDMTVAGGTPNYTYAWSNGATTQDLTALVGGAYMVTITDANGCLSTATTTVATATAMVVNVDTIYHEILNITGGIDLTVTGGSGTFQYAWSNGSTTDDITGLSAGTYSVTIVDAVTGCQTILGGLVVNYQIPDLVNNIEMINSFKLYPNPTTDKVFVQLVLNESTDVQLQITNLAGQLVHSFAPRQAAEQNYEIDMSQYPAGVYLARFIIGNQVTTTKIVVTK